MPKKRNDYGGTKSLYSFFFRSPPVMSPRHIVATDSMLVCNYTGRII